MEGIDAVDFHLHMIIFGGWEDGDVGLAEDDEEVAFAGVFEVGGHVAVGVHAGFKDGDAAELVEVGGGGVVEGAGDEEVETSVTGLAGGGDEVGTGDGAELGAD